MALGIQELASQYGYAASFFSSDPELEALLNSAVKGQWTVDKFKAKFMATAWYRTKAASVRQWIEQQGRDPATAQAQIDQQRVKIQNIASRAGITLNVNRLKQMAHDSLMFGLDDEQLQRAIAAEWHYQPQGGNEGQAASLETQMRRIASDYGVSLSDSQVGQWIQGALAGKYDENNYTGFIRDMARSRYPGMNHYLDQGYTVRQVASPYIQSYASILEVDPDTVQLNDPRLQKALQGQQDKTGIPKMQSVYDFENTLRQDPRWLNTKNAHQELSAVGSKVLRDMGLVS